MGSNTFFKQVKALTKKNFIVFKRDKRAIACETLIPILLSVVISLIVSQLPKAKDKQREYRYKDDGKYLGYTSEVSYLQPKQINNSSEISTMVALVGKNETHGKQMLMSIMNDHDIAYDARFESLSTVRDYISKSDDHRQSNISYILKLDIDDSQKKYELTTLKSDFSSTFRPFYLDQSVTINYSEDEYIGYNSENGDSNYIGSVAQLIAEKVGQEKTGAPLTINAGYAQKSNQPYTYTILPDVMDQMYPIFIVIIFTLPYMYFLQRAVEEKQTKTRESMRMMGMVDSAYWTSWFIMFMAQVLFTSAILTIGSIFTLFPG